MPEDDRPAAGPGADPLAPLAVRSAATDRRDPLQVGHLSKAYLIWLGGASCDGCTVAVTGGAHPRLEQLLTGAVPGVPRLELIHTGLAVESGPEWIENLLMAERGDLDAPYVLTWEGSVMDESSAGEGYWGGLGQDPDTGRQCTSREWLARLAPGAAAVIAVGTCATWGGIPAAAGGPTGATGVTEYLGGDFRSAAGLPVVNVPGCAPVGDNYLDAATALLLHLNGLAPLPRLDELGRPAWLYSEVVRPPGSFGEAGSGDAPRLPVVHCNVGTVGVIEGRGGCMEPGGACIGCTMPGFPDSFAPVRGPGPARPATAVARVEGGLRRRYLQVAAAS